MDDDITQQANTAITDNSSSLDDQNAAADITKSEDFLKAKKDLEENFLEDGDTYEDLLQKDILDMMGFKDLSEEKRNILHEKIRNAIENRVAIKVLDALNDQDLKEYESLTDSSDREKLEEFFKSRGIDYLQLTLVELIRMKLELYQDSKMIKQKIGEMTKKNSGE